jgi:acyl carrier protein
LLGSTPRERRHALEEHLRREVGRVLGISWLRVDPRQPLGAYGLESVKGAELIARLEDLLGLSLPTTLVYNRPTVADISDFVSERMAEHSRPSGSEGGRHGEEARSEVDERAIELLGKAKRLSEAEMERLMASRRSRYEGTS